MRDMHETYYEGDPGSTGVVIRRNGQIVGKLNPRFDLRNHSPTGLAWGYEGSGPSQLALALCAHALTNDAGAIDEERAMRVYQEVKRTLVATQPQSKPFFASRTQVNEAILDAEALLRDAYEERNGVRDDAANSDEAP